MRIALVVTGGVDRSGRERVIPALLWLVERLARRHQVVVYALRYHEAPCSYPLLGATVHDLGRPEGAVRQYRALVSALRRDGPFHVIHGYWALPSGLAASAAGRRLRIPAVVTLDSGELVALPDIGYGLQHRFLQRRAVDAAVRLSRRVTVSSRYMERLARAHGIVADVIPIGVDTTRFVPAQRADGPPWRLISVASLNPVKDHLTLLRAFRHVQTTYPGAHLDVVGEDTLNGAVQALARELGVASHVTFHGALPSDALVPLYQRAHLFVLSSRHEAANVAVLEAAASGVGVVGTAVGHLADWSGELARTCAPGDAGQLASIIALALANWTETRRLAERARAWAVRHDADWTAAQFEHLYRSLHPVL